MADPDHIFQWRRGGETEVKVLVVLLWGKGSEVVFYRDSHRHQLSGVKAANLLLEVPKAALDKAGCVAVPVKLDNGGW